jgi:hypothetical protein
MARVVGIHEIELRPEAHGHIHAKRSQDQRRPLHMIPAGTALF